MSTEDEKRMQDIADAKILAGDFGLLLFKTFQLADRRVADDSPSASRTRDKIRSMWSDFIEQVVEFAERADS